MADIALVGLGIDLFTGILNKADQKKSQRDSLKAQAKQFTSDAATARSNADILGLQSDAFVRQQEEVIGDIGEQGASVSAERAALAAAEGFGGGGTSRSVQSGISRKVNRDIGRVRDSITEQTGIFALQEQQQLDQATALDEQATFASKTRSEIKRTKWYNPTTWF